jgi:hypothetical protein
MNPYYYVLDDFSDADMEVVKNMFYIKLYPIHKEKSINSANKSKTNTHQVVTYFHFDNINLSSAEKLLFLKYPMLGTDCLINESGLLGGTIPHIDGHPAYASRQCAINFPITGGNNLSPTVFFGQLNDYDHFYDDSKRTSYIKEGIQPIEKARVYLIDKPVLINVKTWHTVKNFSNNTRIAFSWSCRPGIAFNDAYNTLKK